jgi:hypothetical protein
MRRLLAVLTALALCLLIAPRSLAFPGSQSDPADAPSRALDVKTLYHRDDASSVTYGIVMQNNWNAAGTPGYHITWFLDLDLDGGFDDACVLMQKDPNSSDPYFWRLYPGACDGAGNAPSLPVKDSGHASRPADPPGATELVGISLQALRDAGLGTGSQYKYQVKTYECITSSTTTTTSASSTTSTSGPTTTTTAPSPDCASSVPSDTAPDSGGITHTLGDVQTTATTSGGGSGGGGGGTTATTLAGSVTQSAATVSKSVVDAGDAITMSGSGFAANASPLTEQIFSDPVTLGTTSANSAGAYSVVIRIPANTLPGTHTLMVSGANPSGHRHESVATITVRLPRTGAANTSRTASTGIAVIALGFALMSLAYYERHRVSVGASKATAAITTALKRFEL